MQAQSPIHAFFVGELFHIAGRYIGYAVLVNRQAELVSVVTNLNVVLLVAGEVLEQRTEMFVFHNT